MSSTSSLDPKGSHEFCVFLQRLAAENIPILMATHDLFRAKEVSTAWAETEQRLSLWEFETKLWFLWRWAAPHPGNYCRLAASIMIVLPKTPTPFEVNGHHERPKPTPAR